MLNNLDELHYNLTSLIEELSDIQSQIINPISAKKSNSHSFLVKLPKVILIIKITPYLDYKDIVSLSSVCSALRKAIYSPIGWRLLNYVQSPYPLTVKELIPIADKYGNVQYNQMENYQMHQMLDQKNLKKSRMQCKKELMQTFQKYNTKKQKYESLVQQLRVEKTSLMRLKLQRMYLDDRRKQLSEQNTSYKNQLKLTNEGFSDKTRQLDKVNQQLMQQNIKLQNQKGALVNKIREYQSEIQTIKVESQRSKQILKKIKNYLLYKQL